MHFSVFNCFVYGLITVLFPKSDTQAVSWTSIPTHRRFSVFYIHEHRTWDTFDVINQFVKFFLNVKPCINSVTLTPLPGFHSGCRSSSFSLSPVQQRRENIYFRTPPISREKHKITTNLIDGSRVGGHVYKHLQEDESTDMDSLRRWNFFLFSFVSLSDPRGENTLCPLYAEVK